MESLLVALLVVGSASEVPTVVIDAGHGGTHEGAVGVCGAKEKDVTLAVSLEVTRLLGATGRVRTVLTREDDTTVELMTRAERANAEGATLFLSVHANSGGVPTSHGVETYFLSRAGSDKRTDKLVQRENEGHSTNSLAASSPLAKVLRGMSLAASHRESERLASRVQTGLPSAIGARARGVMQAPFMVLMGAQMAAALVEIGFLSNPEECALLASEAHRAKISAALAAAVLAHLDGEATLASALPQHAP